MWIDLGKLIREHVPDKNGKPLPPDLSSGSYEFRDLTNTGAGTLFEGKVIYDKTYGHVVYGCGTSCGYALANVFYNPIGVRVANSAFDGVNGYNNCTATWDDESDSFYNKWVSAYTAVATVDYYGTHTGVSVASTTSSTLGYLDGVKYAPSCPLHSFNPSGGINVTPDVTFGSFWPTPILQGTTATPQMTVNPAATVQLAITRTGSGAASFDNQGGPTTMTISGTTTVTIYRSTASTNSGDLTVTPSYNGTTLKSIPFSVSSGACTVGIDTVSDGGQHQCPSSVTLTDSYPISNYCPTCTYSCTSVHTDGNWVPAPGSCTSIGHDLGGSLTATAVTSATATFSASDCNSHYAYFVTTVTNAQNVKTNHPGANTGLMCASNSIGYPCP